MAVGVDDGDGAEKLHLLARLQPQLCSRGLRIAGLIQNLAHASGHLIGPDHDCGRFADGNSPGLGRSQPLGPLGR